MDIGSDSSYIVEFFLSIEISESFGKDMANNKAYYRSKSKTCNTVSNP